MAGIGGLLPPVIAELMGDISDFQAKMSAARGEMTKTEAAGSSAFTKLATVGKYALIGTSVLAVGVGVAGVKMAEDFETAHARLVSGVKASGSTMQAWSKVIEEATAKGAKLGENAGDVENSLSRLAIAGNSPAEALRLLAIAEDLAAARHMPLEQALQAVVRASGGTYTSLGRLGIATKEQVKGFTSSGQAVQFLADKFHGQADRAAGTFGGKLRAVGADAENIGIKIGQFLIPIITRLADAVLDIVNWFERHRTVAIALAAVVGTLLVGAITAYVVSAVGGAIAATTGLVTGFVAAVPAVIGYATAMGSAAVATIAATWPILAIVAGIAVLVGVIVAFATQWDAIWSWIQSNPAYAAVIAALLLFIAPILLIGAAIGALAANWDAVMAWISQAASDAAAWIGGAIATIIGWVHNVAGVWDGVIGAWANAWQWIIGVVKSGINAVIGAWDSFARWWNGVSIDLPSVDLGPLGEVGGGSFTLPHLPVIPTLHQGGIFQAPPGQNEGLALLLSGERVSRPGGGGGDIYNITVKNAGSVVTAGQLVDQIHEGLLRKQRRNGSLGLNKY